MISINKKMPILIDNEWFKKCISLEHLMYDQEGEY